MIKTIIIEKLEDLKLLLDKDVVSFEVNWPRGILTKYQYPYGCRSASQSKYTKNLNEGVPEDVYTSCLTCIVFGGTITAQKEVFRNYE